MRIFVPEAGVRPTTLLKTDQAYIFIKKRLQYLCFPLNFAKCLAYCMTYEMPLYGKYFVVHILNLMKSHKWYHLRISCNKPQHKFEKYSLQKNIFDNVLKDLERVTSTTRRLAELSKQYMKKRVIKKLDFYLDKL